MDAGVEQIAEEQNAVHQAWQWDGDESMHPFWAVRRLTRTELEQEPGKPEFNLKYLPRVHTISMIQATHTIKWNVTIPEYTNIRLLHPGTELIHQQDEVKDESKKKKKEKEKTWIDDDAEREKKKTKTHL